MKNIIGLDLGTNSIGWARVSVDESGSIASDIKLGSRIIPMTQDVMSAFDKGQTESSTAKRTEYRGARRLRERSLQRRERLFRVLHILGFLPEHFDNAIGWDKNDNKTYGKLKDLKSPVALAWRKAEDDTMEFIFKDAFHEMIADFAKSQPGLVADGRNVPLDWTIYYLRQKALTREISKQQLAWIILNFNQKRGYYQLRGEELDSDSDDAKQEEYKVLRVDDVQLNPKSGKNGEQLYNLILEDGSVCEKKSRVPLFDWKGKQREFIITTSVNKKGEKKQSFRSPKDEDWGLRKKRSESYINSSGLTVGAYIYQHLLGTPYDKIRGKFVHTIERKYYKDELIQILEAQKQFHPELADTGMLEACVKELYAKNIPHQQSLMKKDMLNLIVNDILFYQRPLKSKKSLIADCPYEEYRYVDKQTGEIKIQHIKCIAKSNPYFQEFRLWQFIQNLRLFSTDIDAHEVTPEYLKSEDDYVSLFKYLNDKDCVSQEGLLKDFFHIRKPKGKDSKMPVRWNYVEDKKYPCNETRSRMLKALQSCKVSADLIGDKATEYRLWHLLYSVEDNNELEGALRSFAQQRALDDAFVKAFLKIPAFKKEYGAYSEKATKKLLAVMRTGEMWDASMVPVEVEKVITGEIDENIKMRMSHQNISLAGIGSMKFLPVWLACYVVYGRHSEAKEIDKWNTPADLQRFIRNFKQHSLRNPIVEQVVLETLRTVHDIWTECGHIDEIHVELGRSMKSTAEQRVRMTQRNLENENTNMRIKHLLMELKETAGVADVRPYSPMQQEILRIYEEGALQELTRDDKDYDEIKKISRAAAPTQSELTRYRLWLEQKYRSPYTGRTISLSKLFTPAYQIEHVIPQARYFDDSLSNKVICEAEVNKLKTNRLGMEFIKECGGQIVHCTTLGDVTILSEKEYKEFVKDHYASNRTKASKLLMEDIPEAFIERQMNDTRYITKYINSLLSNIVREEGEIDATSKNVIPCSGGITGKLKQDWGLNDVWNRIITPRFERMNRIDGSDAFGCWTDKEGKRVFQTKMPLELQRGFSRKRIDHRHHAMDALVIALASRNVVNYLNNDSARDTARREDLRRLLCDKNRIIRKPWDTFTQDAQAALENIVVSFKNYVRVINNASNYYEHYDDNGKKKLFKQEGENRWAIRKSLHKVKVFGPTNLHRQTVVPIHKAVDNTDNIVDKELRRTILDKQKQGWTNKQIAGRLKDGTLTGQCVASTAVYYFSDDVKPMVAVRTVLDKSFDQKKIATITDTGIQKILLNYLAYKGGDPELAFSPEGVMDMNKHIADFNGGKCHLPIVKVRIASVRGEKFSIGNTGINDKKFVVTDDCTNLYFAIYEDADGKRSYRTVPLNEVVERLKQKMSPVPETNEKGIPLKFYLSPNDLVYVPTDEEKQSGRVAIDSRRIYKMVSTDSGRAYFIPSYVASMVKPNTEFFSHNRIENLEDGTSIKSVCWKLEVDRLGRITKMIR